MTTWHLTRTMDYLDLYDFQEETGVVVPNDANILLSVQEQFKNIFGNDLDISPETPVGRLIEGFAVLIKSALGVTAQNANQIDPHTATGQYLDAIAGLFGLYRTPATKTKIGIVCKFNTTMSHVGAVGVPKGSYIISKDTADRYVVDTDIAPSYNATDGTGYSYGKGTATAVEYGPAPGTIGTVTIINSVVSNWIGVENDRLISVGHDVETDESLRQRILSMKYEGSGFMRGMKTALAKVDGVKNVCILENNYPDMSLRNGVRLIGHSVYICLYLGDAGVSETLKTAIGDAIVDTISLGCGTKGYDAELLELGALCFEATPSVSTSGPIYFYTPAKTEIAVTIKASPAVYSGTSMVSDIQESASRYVESVGIGETVYVTEFAKAITTDVPNAIVRSVEMSIKGDVTAQSSSQTSIQTYAFQKAILAKEDVSVIIE